MAASVKDREVELTPRLVNGTIKSVLDAYGDLESARGQYMNRARTIRERMAAAYEAAAASGIPQKVMKLQVKILQKVEDLQGLFTELEAAEQDQLRKIAKIHGNPVQLKMFAELPVAKVPKVKVVKSTGAAAEAAKAKKKHPGVTGDELAEAEARGTA